MFKKILLSAVIGTLLIPSLTSAMRIGYYDSSRESWGFSSGSAGPYLSEAANWLVAQGHTLVPTNNVTEVYLSGVDAFFTGLINYVDGSEIEAMQNFVDEQGGFLFIQTDWTTAPWTGPANDILSNWGISHSGYYTNDANHQTVGNSDWVTEPNEVTTFISGVHSAVSSAPSNFETLAKDDAGRIILGVFDAGAGRSSDVLISTDINMWDNLYGWTDARNRALWENIWTSVERQVAVPEPEALSLLLIGLTTLLFVRRKKN